MKKYSLSSASPSLIVVYSKSGFLGNEPHSPRSHWEASN